MSRANIIPEKTTPHPFFSLAETPEIQEKHIIKFPRIHHPYQEEYLKAFKDHYNDKIRAKRLPIETKMAPLRSLEKAGTLTTAQQQELTYLRTRLAMEKHQLLKDEHLNLMVKLSSMANKEMHFNNENLVSLGLQKIDTTQPVVLSTSGPNIKKWIGANSERTIRRRLRRLQTCGFILGKRFHGWQSNFDLLLDPQMLLISDMAAPEYEASAKLGPSTVKCGFPATWRPIRPPNYTSVMDPSCKKLINAERNSASLHENCAPTENGSKINGSPKTYEHGKPAKATELPKKRAIKQKIEEKNGSFGPRDFSDLPSYAFAKVVILFAFARRMLWNDRDIFPGAICNTEDMIFDQYLKPAKTYEDVDQRITYLMELVKTEADWKNADPDNRFTPLPAQWFDKRRAQADDDFSCLMGKHKKIKDQAVHKCLEPEIFTINRAFTKLRKRIKQLEKHRLTPYREQRFKEWVEKNVPLLRTEANTYLATGEWPKNPGRKGKKYDTEIMLDL